MHVIRHDRPFLRGSEWLPVPFGYRRSAEVERTRAGAAVWKASRPRGLAADEGLRAAEGTSKITHPRERRTLPG